MVNRDCLLRVWDEFEDYTSKTGSDVIKIDERAAQDLGSG